MSSRMSRIVFGKVPAQAGGLLDAGVEELPMDAPALESLLPGDLRRRLLSDERLAGRLQLGDSDALTTLFERHSPLLFTIAKRILRSEAEAEDAVQQIFLDVFRSIQQFDPEKGEFKTWLLMFAYHRSFNWRRHLRSTGFFCTDPLEETLLQVVPGAYRSATYPLVEAGILIKQVLGHLEERQRRTIELVYYDGLTAEEVAARTGETVRVVRHNLYRGLDKIRNFLFQPAGVAVPNPDRKERKR